MGWFRVSDRNTDHSTAMPGVSAAQNTAPEHEAWERKQRNVAYNEQNDKNDRNVST